MSLQSINQNAPILRSAIGNVIREVSHQCEGSGNDVLIVAAKATLVVLTTFAAMAIGSALTVAGLHLVTYGMPWILAGITIFGVGSALVSCGVTVPITTARTITFRRTGNDWDECVEFLKQFASLSAIAQITGAIGGFVGLGSTHLISQLTQARDSAPA